MAGRSGGLAAAVLVVLTVAGGCAAIKPQPALPAANAVAAPATMTTAPPDARKAALLEALLKEVDVPGSKELHGESGSSESSSAFAEEPACAPFAADPNAGLRTRTVGPELELVMGNTKHHYNSMVEEGPPELLAKDITEAASPAGRVASRLP